MSQQFEREISADDVADFLGKGLLGTLVSLFRAEPSLYPLIGELLVDERIATRVGASALVETLVEEDPAHVHLAVQSLMPLLGDDRPLVRGDAAWLLGVIGRPEALAGLQPLLRDPDQGVREAAAEAVESIEVRAG